MKYMWRVRENQNGSSELYHHGIKGMKWGIRRTPEQLGHRRKTLNAKPLKYISPEKEKIKNQITSAIKVATMPVPIVGLATILHDVIKEASYRDKYLDPTNYPKGTEKLSELKRKPEGKVSSILDDVKQVNKTGKKGYVKNCFNCVCALEMRRRGYDVEALPTTRGGDSEAYKRNFDGVVTHNTRTERKPNESRKDWVLRSYDNLCRDLEKNPEGSRGYIGFMYDGCRSGHTISWFIENGQAVFYDPQAAKRYADDVLSFSDQWYIWGRLDNTTPTEAVTEVVGSKGKEKIK